MFVRADITVRNLQHRKTVACSCSFCELGNQLKWNLTNSSGTLQIQVEPYKFKWSLTNSSGTLQIQVEPYKFKNFNKSRISYHMNFPNESCKNWKLDKHYHMPYLELLFLWSSTHYVKNCLIHAQFCSFKDFTRENKQSGKLQFSEVRKQNGLLIVSRNSSTFFQKVRMAALIHSFSRTKIGYCTQ